MHSALELHDSTLTRITRVDRDVVLSFAPAYVHQSGGRPGIDPGFGCLQDVDLTITEADCKSLAVQLPCRLNDGKVSADKSSNDNVVPLPFIAAGAISFMAVTEHGERIFIEGVHASLVTRGVARHLEDFPGDGET